MSGLVVGDKVIRAMSAPPMTRTIGVGTIVEVLTVDGEAMALVQWPQGFTRPVMMPISYLSLAE